MNLQESIRRTLREDSRVYDYDPERNTVPFDERLPFDVDKLLSVGAVFITPAIDGDPKSKTYKEWLNEPYVHLITLKNVLDSNPDSWIHKAITKKADPESYRKDFVYKFYDGKYNQILWSLEKLGIDPNDMIEDKDNSIQESIRRILREETSLKTDIKDMISKHGFFITSKMLGGVDTMNSILNIKGSQEEMIFIVKAIMEHDIEVLTNVCNYQIIPTIHSFKLYVEIPKYYPNHSDDYFPNKQKTFEARDYISDLIKKFGNEKVRGYNIYVQIGNC